MRGMAVKILAANCAANADMRVMYGRKRVNKKSLARVSSSLVPCSNMIIRLHLNILLRLYLVLTLGFGLANQGLSLSPFYSLFNDPTLCPTVEPPTAASRVQVPLLSQVPLAIRSGRSASKPSASSLKKS